MKTLLILFITIAIAMIIGSIGHSDRYHERLEQASAKCQGLMYTDGFNQCVTSNMEATK